MVTAASCPICGDGSRIGFRMCADKETIVCVCDGCAFVWMDPTALDGDHARDPLRPDFKRHYPGVSLQPSRWATLEEVLSFGWGQYVQELAMGGDT